MHFNFLALSLLNGCSDYHTKLPVMSADQCQADKLVGTIVEGQCLTWIFGKPNARQIANHMAEYCQNHTDLSYYVDVRRDSVGGSSKLWISHYYLRTQHQTPPDGMTNLVAHSELPMTQPSTDQCSDSKLYFNSEAQPYIGLATQKPPFVQLLLQSHFADQDKLTL